MKVIVGSNQAGEVTVRAGRQTAPDLIVFDGECLLCSRFFQFMLRRDRAGRFFFTTAQSPLGQRLYREQGLSTDNLDTMLVFVDGRCYQRLDALAAAMRVLPGAWPLLSLCRYLPSWIKDPVYLLIARNRYRLFGRRDQCLLPDAQTRDRFLQ